jgi:hypothetical protein
MNKTYLLAITSLSILFFGCGETSSNIDSSYNNPLVRVVDFATSDDNTTKEQILNECGVVGGVAILSGYDRDSDGFLSNDGEEVDPSDIKFICNGQDTIVSDIALSNFDATKRAEYEKAIVDQCGVDNDGGSILSIGYDTDGDGELTVGVDDIYDYSVVCGSKNLYFEVINGETSSILRINNNGKAVEDLVVTNGIDGIDGISPTAKVLSIGDGGDCNSSGGFEITDANGTKYYVCNGDSPTVRIMSDTEKTENCDGTAGYFIIDTNQTKFPVCQPASLATIAINKTTDGNLTISGSDYSLQIPREVTLFESNLTAKAFGCQNGGIKVTTFIDLNINNILDTAENNSSKEATICNGENSVNLVASKVKSVNLNDNNLSISFSFSHFMNPITVNESSVILECNSDRVDGWVEFDYYNENISDFNFTYSKDNLPTPTTNLNCKFSVLKYVEDLNGSNLSDNNLTNLTISVN